MLSKPCSESCCAYVLPNTRNRSIVVSEILIFTMFLFPKKLDNLIYVVFDMSNVNL